jgi:hypothetical protein
MKIDFKAAANAARDIAIELASWIAEQNHIHMDNGNAWVLHGRTGGQTVTTEELVELFFITKANEEI